MIINIKY